jgi:peptidoglycan/xylan/chitin deacetylase (PgdA/CDA1 family)
VAPSNLPAQPPASPAPGTQPPEATTIPAEDPTRVAVLGYHDFSETLPETAMRIRTSKFRRQMETLRQLGITVISLADFIAWKNGEKSLPEKCALITLDDGWKSVHTDAFPILQQYGYPFTLYLYKSYVDGGNKALDTPTIQTMIRAGMTIGSHSVSHPYPATIKARRKKGADVLDAFLRKEMGESKRFLESKFGQSIATYAYPGGFHTEEMMPLAREFGYSHLFTVIPGKVTRETPNETIPRYIILGNHDRIFELATTFRGASGSATPTPDGAISGLIQTTAYPVKPEPGAMVTSRTPEISVDFSQLQDLDPASLTMKVSGFGQVPAVFDPTSKHLRWKIARPLRQSTCQVSVEWKSTTGQPAETPLRWTFQVDRTAAYFPNER